jgi:hypothetical protein
MVAMMLMASNRGDGHFCDQKRLKAFGWAATATMAVAAGTVRAALLLILGPKVSLLELLVIAKR